MRHPQAGTCKLSGLTFEQAKTSLMLFLKQYKYNLDIALNLMQFKNFALKNHDSFKEYGKRWREVASRMQPPLLERELVDIFMGNLQSQYYERMLWNVSSGFFGLVIIGE